MESLKRLKDRKLDVGERHETLAVELEIMARLVDQHLEVIRH